MKINGTNFDIDFVKQFDADKIKKIYNGESEETIKQLIEVCYPVKKTKKDKDV